MKPKVIATRWYSYASCKATACLVTQILKYRTVLIGLLIALMVWMALPPNANASLHTYRERPGQVTYRSRQSLRDYQDRAWQAIAFKRLQNATLQGIYLRLVGFPGAVVVDRQRSVVVTAPTGKQWLLPWQLDPQTPNLPDDVGQYNLQSFLQDIETALPLKLEIPLADTATANIGVAPFVVKEWLQVAATDLSASPVAATLSKKP
ncbi:MAG: DUF3122 domain-containing protein [Cyanobacteria bacterium J06559_3]